MTEPTISWYEHRARVGALEDEISRLRSLLDERGRWIVQERERRDQLRAAARAVVNGATVAGASGNLHVVETLTLKPLRAVLEDNHERKSLDA